jgi:molecular chaperone DnaJ
MRTGTKDYYQILGIKRDASDKEIRAAFRRLARKHHPDVNPNDKNAEAKFKEVNEAYEVLSDAKLRQQYDRFGHLGEGWRHAQQAPPGGGFRYETMDDADFGVGPNFGDIFDMFFGSRGGAATAQQPGATRGVDTEADVEISLEEAFRGTTREISLTVPESCPVCGGTGAAADGSQVCPECRGQGRGGPLGLGICQRCGGQGRIVTKPCGGCRGRGQIERQRRLEVKIPAGVRTGSRVRVASQGGAGDRGRSSGDLYLNIRVRPDRRFTRKGDDLHSEVAISFPQAALGAEIDVPTMKGKVKMTVPPGTSSGQTLRLSGLGIPHLRGGGTGDQYVKVKIVVPKDLSSEERALIDKLARLRGQQSPGDRRTR